MAKPNYAFEKRKRELEKKKKKEEKRLKKLGRVSDENQTEPPSVSESPIVDE